MNRKRAFGTVRRLPSGRWQARYRNRAGGMVTAPRTFPTKGDATRWLAATESDQFRGLWLDPAGGRATLGDYGRGWLTSRVMAWSEAPVVLSSHTSPKAAFAAALILLGPWR
jgi:hypothetical protein